MNFKKEAENIFDKLGYKPKYDLEESFDLVLEGLELDVKEIKENEIKLDVSDDTSDEFDHIEKEEIKDGYLGEMNYAPNPLEYGPNATYRHNGTVYRKDINNLWEVYLKDGQQGPRGFAGGSGVGLQELKNRLGLEDGGDYVNMTKPFKLSNGVIFAPFIQRYVSGNPSVSSMTISASTSQRIALPAGTSFRLWWYGVGPFAYRTGDSSVVALSTDFPAVVGFNQIITTSATHLAVYGVGGGSVTVEGGDGVV